MKLHFDLCGLFSLEVGELYIHFFIWNPDHWFWGHQYEEYDMCLEYYGAGPLFLVVKP